MPRWYILINKTIYIKKQTIFMEVVGFYMFGSGLKSNLVYMCGLQAAQLTFDYI